MNKLVGPRERERRTRDEKHTINMSCRRRTPPSTVYAKMVSNRVESRSQFIFKQLLRKLIYFCRGKFGDFFATIRLTAVVALLQPFNAFRHPVSITLLMSFICLAHSLLTALLIPQNIVHWTVNIAIIRRGRRKTITNFSSFWMNSTR